MTELQLHRIYDHTPTTGYRILTDRLWPRGISKVNAALDLWAKDIAPSNDLRKWFGHEPAKFSEFRERYLTELAANPAAAEFITTVNTQLASGNVILLFGAKDETHNQAVVLRDWLQTQR